MAYANTATITIDHTKCGTADSTNYKLTIAGTYAGSGTLPDLRTTANGGDVANASGYDIDFFSDEELTTSLDFERVGWSATTGVCEFVVEVPTLSFETDTVIYMGYGDATVESDQQSKTGTWETNVKAVYHFEGNSTDSSQSGFNGTDANMTYGTAHGVLGQGASLNGTSSAFTAGTTLMNGPPAKGTMYCWVYPTGDGSGTAEYFQQPVIWGTDGIYHGLMRHYDTNKLIVYWYTGSPNYLLSDAVIPQDAWTHVAVVWGDTENDTIIYINGGVDTDSDVNKGWHKTSAHSGQTFYMGRHGSANGYWFPGKFDEAIYFNNDRKPASWITATYNNQSSPSTFYSIVVPSGVVSGFMTTHSKFW